MLERAVELLKQMDEFARSRYRLEARYHHVLVDEFQDTSRAQWELVPQLVRSWGEGLGASADALPPSIFIVGDRKQSIYGFRDAEVALLDEAAGFVATLGPGQRRVTRFRSASARCRRCWRSSTTCSARSQARQRRRRAYAFRYSDQDRFPVANRPAGPSARGRTSPPLGLLVGGTVRCAAEAVADEIVDLLQRRDRPGQDHRACARAARPADIAILFRSRDSHREFEAALERRGVPTYVYKGLGFFEADEIQDAVALLRYLADPTSNLRAAAFLRSRLVRLSDEAVMRLAPDLAASIIDDAPGGRSDAVGRLDTEDRMVLTRARESVARWLSFVDRMTPAELLDAVLAKPRTRSRSAALDGCRRERT